MLKIVASYHCILFLGKLMKQTWKNGKKPSFRPDFCPFWPKFGLQKTFLWVLPLLDVRNCCILSLYAISRKINEPNLRKWQKTSFGSHFSLFGPNLGPKIAFRQLYLYYMFDIVASYHCMQFQGKLMNKCEKMAKKKTSCGCNFGPFGPNWVHQIFFQKSGSSSY